MAILTSRQDPSGRLVLSPRLLPRLGSLVSTLIWLLVFGIFVLPNFSDSQLNWEMIAFVAIIAVVAVGGSVLSSLMTTSITLDPAGRVLTMTRGLVGIPLRTTTVPFSDLSNIAYDYYRQSSGRSSHDAWRVSVVDKNGKRIPLNWDGKQAEMADLAQKVAEVTHLEVADHSIRKTRTAQEILETIRDRLPGGTPGSETAPDSRQAPSMPVAPTPDTMMPDLASPMPTPPDAMPMPDYSSLPSTPAETASTGDITGPSSPAQSSTQNADLRTASREELEQRVSSDSMDSDARYALARLYQMSGRSDRAIELYEETLRLDSTNAEAQNDLGVALWQRGKRTEAEAAFRRATALDPYSSTAHLNLGLALRSEKRMAEASQEFYQARRNARGPSEEQLAENASTGAKVDPQLSAKQG